MSHKLGAKNMFKLIEMSNSWLFCAIRWQWSKLDKTKRLKARRRAKMEQRRSTRKAVPSAPSRAKKVFPLVVQHRANWRCSAIWNQAALQRPLQGAASPVAQGDWAVVHRCSANYTPLQHLMREWLGPSPRLKPKTCEKDENDLLWLMDIKRNEESNCKTERDWEEP